MSRNKISQSCIPLDQATLLGESGIKPDFPFTTSVKLASFFTQTLEVIQWIESTKARATEAEKNIP